MLLIHFLPIILGLVFLLLVLIYLIYHYLTLKHKEREQNENHELTRLNDDVNFCARSLLSIIDGIFLSVSRLKREVSDKAKDIAEPNECAERLFFFSKQTIRDKFLYAISYFNDDHEYFVSVKANVHSIPANVKKYPLMKKFPVNVPLFNFSVNRSDITVDLRPLSNINLQCNSCICGVNYIGCTANYEGDKAIKYRILDFALHLIKQKLICDKTYNDTNNFNITLYLHSGLTFEKDTIILIAKGIFKNKQICCETPVNDSNNHLISLTNDDFSVATDFGPKLEKIDLGQSTSDSVPAFGYQYTDDSLSGGISGNDSGLLYNEFVNK